MMTFLQILAQAFSLWFWSELPPKAPDELVCYTPAGHRAPAEDCRQALEAELDAR